MLNSKRFQALPAMVAAAAVAAILAASPGMARQDEQPTAQATTATGAPIVTPPSSPTPPRTGRFVGDHWTPYEPPSAESFPQGSTLHIIVKDDTLWDLAGHYLGNPYLWPQIWDVNRYITDSHWIYPGDPLLIPPRPTVIGEAGPPVPAEPAGPSDPDAVGSLEPQTDEEPATPVQAAAPAPPVLTPAGPTLVPIADESDVECASYILERYERPALMIKEREDPSRTVLATGDVVFLNQGSGSGLVTGSEFSILNYEGVVPHPIFDEEVGESVRPVGRLRIIAIQEKSATAQIVQACDAIVMGMALIPYEETPVPITPPVDFRRYGVHLDPKNAGYIVDSSPDKVAVGTGDIINVDLGSENGVQPGDILTVFREYSGVIQFNSTESYVDGLQARAERHRIEGTLNPEDTPQTILGQVLVLKTRKHTATAKVITASRELNLGDRVASR